MSIYHDVIRCNAIGQVGRHSERAAREPSLSPGLQDDHRIDHEERFSCKADLREGQIVRKGVKGTEICSSGDSTASSYSSFGLVMSRNIINIA